jgi:hypothetical protein
VLAIFVGYWIVRSATVNDFGHQRPQIAALMAPRDPRVVAGLVDLDLRTRMGMARESVKKSARAAMVRAPLMEEPFLLAGIDAVLKRDNRSAGRYLRHALDRNPRSRLARLFMLELELRSGQAEGAVEDMTILSRLMPDVQRVFVPELARFARDPETRPALKEVLSGDPRMLGRVLQHLAAKGDDPAVILWLAGDHPPIVTDGSEDWRRTLLDTMVKKGDIRRARLLWGRFSGLEAKDANAIYDSNFEGLPGLPPFNWSFSSSDIGAAERDKSGALQVEYYGRAAGDLATQLLTLAPGRYRLLFHAEGDLATPQHRLVWTVSCRNDNKVLLELPIANVTYAGRTIAGDFAVPAGCAAQWLKLAGVPTEFPKIENVLIRNIHLQRIGGAS